MIAGIQSVPSPGLIVFPDRVHANITRMIQMAGSPDRLRPHLKTAKMPETFLGFPCLYQMTELYWQQER